LAQDLQLEKETKGVAAGQRGWLAISFVRSSLFSILPRAVRQFRQTHPEIQLELMPMQSEVQPAELRPGPILGDYDRIDGLHYWDIQDDPFMVALPAAHSLGRRKGSPRRRAG